jgi:hypothetical protein
MSKKKDKNQNALKHGAYSGEVMLPGEKIGDYEALRQAYYDEWAPEGVTEQCLVDDIVALHWRKRRMVQYFQIGLQQRDTKIRERNKNARQIGDLKDLAEEFSETDSVEAVEEILRWLNPLYAVTIRECIPHDKCEDPAKWGQEIGKYLSNLESRVPLKGPELFAAIVDLNSIEVEILRSDRLDEAIDRKIKRIMQVKTAKQIFPNMRRNAKPEPKLISSPAAADGKPATPAEIIVSAEKEAIAVQSGVVIEGTPIDEGGSASVSPDVTEKEHSGVMRAKVDFFAKPTPATVEELDRFSALCERVMTSNTSSNRAS